MLQVATLKSCHLVGLQKHASTMVAPTVWNTLPPEIQWVPSLLAFQEAVQTSLFTEVLGLYKYGRKSQLGIDNYSAGFVFVIVLFIGCCK